MGSGSYLQQHTTCMKIKILKKNAMEIYMNENIQADALDRFGVTTSEFISWLSADLGHVVTIIVQFDTCN